MIYLYVIVYRYVIHSKHSYVHIYQTNDELFTKFIFQIRLNNHEMNILGIR